MENMDLKINGDILTITVDLSKTIGKSNSGKSVNIATTSGNKKVPGRENLFIGLNIYEPIKEG